MPLERRALSRVVDGLHVVYYLRRVYPNGVTYRQVHASSAGTHHLGGRGGSGGRCSWPVKAGEDQGRRWPISQSGTASTSAAGRERSTAIALCGKHVLPPLGKVR